MNITTGVPPYDIATRARAKFGNLEGMIFCFGDTIYTADGPDTLPPDVIAHEKVHMVQQTSGAFTPAQWWSRYLADPLFRLEQELAAFRAQYDYCVANQKDRNAQVRSLRFLAQQLSGPAYGNVVSFSEAMQAIRIRD